jgi:hypothetical protein
MYKTEHCDTEQSQANLSDRFSFSSLQAGITGSIPVTSTNFFSDCKTLTEFISFPTRRLSCTGVNPSARGGGEATLNVAAAILFL